MADVGEGRLTYTVGGLTQDKSYFINFTKDLSWLNSKGYEHTTRDGHVYGYLVDLMVLDEQDNKCVLFGAGNTWKMRNSFRKFHFKRKEMFRDAGITGDELGRYGKTLRPYLHPDMVDVTPDPGGPTIYQENNVLIPVQCTDGQREWTYSSLASNPGWMDYQSIGEIVDDPLSRLMPLADEWKLTILGNHDVQAETTGSKIQSWFTVSMIQAYNEDRMEVVTPDEGETITGPNNPLAALSFQGDAVGEVVDIAEDQELEATPYDIRDIGDSTALSFFDFTRTDGSTLRMNYMRNVFVPAGILGLAFDVEPTEKAALFTQVKAIVECREWV